MRRRLSAVLMMTLCLLLASCGMVENAIGDALKFREELREAGGCRFSAEVLTEIAGREYSFSMAAEYPTEGETKLTILAPETIAGITASVTDRNAILAFDGIALDFGRLDEAVTSPLYAPVVFGQCWDTAYIDCGGMDGEEYRVTYRLGYGDEELILETWFSDGAPVRCELYRESKMLLSARIGGFTFLT